MVAIFNSEIIHYIYRCLVMKYKHQLMQMDLHVTMPHAKLTITLYTKLDTDGDQW